MTADPTYVAVQFPRGNCVVQKPENITIAALPSMGEANAYAEALNRWLESQPTPKTFLGYRDFEAPARTPNEHDLLAILDGIYLADDRLDVLEESLRSEFAELGRAA